jgi:hypothetical protein
MYASLVLEQSVSRKQAQLELWPPISVSTEKIRGT